MDQTVPQAERDRVIAMADFRPLMRHVPAEDVPSHWPAVEKGLAAVLAKCRGEPWTARDIRRHLLRGQAALFVHPQGFAVLERCQEAISGEPYMNVWLMWFEAGSAMPALRDPIVAWLDEMRQQMKCEWWQFSSPRDGWMQWCEDVCERAYVTWKRR